MVAVRAEAAGCIAMVPDDDNERGPSTELLCRRGRSMGGASDDEQSASGLGRFGVPFRAPGPPVICRMGCGRAGFDQSNRRADICCAECHQGRGHSRLCDIRNGVYPDPEPDPDPPDPEPDPDYDTDIEPDYGMEPGDGTSSGSAADTDAVEVDGRRGAVMEEGTRGRVLMRGDYITFTEYFHGEGAIGVMSVMDNAGAPGLTFMGGFDVMQDAHDLVTERHGFPPHLCDAAAFYADPSALCVADVVGAGAPCQGSSFAPHFGRGTEPDADDPRNAHYAEQVHVIVRGADVAVLEYLADVKKVRSTNPTSPNAHRAPGWLSLIHI